MKMQYVYNYTSVIKMVIKVSQKNLKLKTREAACEFSTRIFITCMVFVSSELSVSAHSNN